MMYIPEKTFTEASHILTSSGNVVSRSAILHRPENVEIPSGKCIIEERVHVHGDLAPVKLNKYVIIGEGTTLSPPCINSDGEELKYIPMTIGKYVCIGSNSEIQAAIVGMGVIIGNNCWLGPRCILKDYVQVEDGAFVPPNMVTTIYSFFSLLALLNPFPHLPISLL